MPAADSPSAVFTLARSFLALSQNSDRSPQAKFAHCHTSLFSNRHLRQPFLPRATKAIQLFDPFGFSASQKIRGLTLHSRAGI
jgi:hypothetical protein